MYDTDTHALQVQCMAPQANTSNLVGTYLVPWKQHGIICVGEYQMNNNAIHLYFHTVLFGKYSTAYGKYSTVVMRKTFRITKRNYLLTRKCNLSTATLIQYEKIVLWRES